MIEVTMYRRNRRRSSVLIREEPLRRVVSNTFARTTDTPLVCQGLVSFFSKGTCRECTPWGLRKYTKLYMQSSTASAATEIARE